MNQQQALMAMKVNPIPGCISKTKGSGLRGVIVYAQHSCRLIWNTESGFQVTPPPPTTTKKRDADKLERVQKAATMTVSWLED